MPPTPRPVAGKPPKELKDLAKFLADRGFTLALPFDDIRKPGYIGGFNDRGQEIIVDDGECLKNLTTRKPGTVVLGDFKKASRFSFKSFLSALVNVLTVNIDFLRVKNVSLRFPKRFIQTEFITVVDLEEHLDKVSTTCRRKITDPSNFLILQVLETDSIAYQYDVEKKLDVDAKANLEKTVAAAAKVSKVEANVHFESTNSFTIELEGKSLSVAYKTATVGIKPLEPADMVKHRIDNVG